MDEIIVNDKKVTFINPEQIINMGGPWIGEMLIDNYKITDNVIIDNLFHYKDENKLYFVRYHQNTKWLRDNFFTINFLDLSTSIIYMIDIKFSIVYISNIQKNEIIYYKAFHDQNEKLKMILNFSDADIKQIY